MKISTAEAFVCLQYQGIDNNASVVDRVRRAHKLSNNNRGVSRGRVIRNTFDGSEKTAEAAGARQWPQGIYDDDGGVGGGI